jgi:hypothetical protein
MPGPIAFTLMLLPFALMLAFLVWQLQAVRRAQREDLARAPAEAPEQALAPSESTDLALAPNEVPDQAS